MISHKLKFIFIHIPKTSGNSLSLFLKEYIDNEVIIRASNMGENQGISILCEKTKCNIKHKSIEYYKNIYNKNIINNYFKFTIVRNPYDRILSFYFFTKGKSNKTFHRNEFIMFLYKCNSFQYKYIDNSFHVIHYENLNDELKNINCLKEVVNFDLYPTLNSSSNFKNRYKTLFDKQLKDLVYNKFRKDFEIFGYSY